MKSILREQRRSSIVAAAVTILLGLMLVLVPNRSIRFLCGLLGTALMVTGLTAHNTLADHTPGWG